jgi:hypothetical protein
MMKRLATLAIAAIMVVGSVVGARAATEVKMVGDALIYGDFWSHRNFTGWNPGGTAKEEHFEIWERFRLRTDFVANEAVKFRLGLRVQDTWGHGTYTAANPQASVSVYQAYLQFKYPGSDVEISAGLQDFSLPQNAIFCDSVVFGGTRTAALVINTPLIPETLSVVTGYSRMVQNGNDFTSNSRVSASSTGKDYAQNLDMYFLTLPVTIDGFKATPWAAVAVAGRDVDYTNVGTYGMNNALGENLTSAGSFLDNKTGGRHIWNNAQNPFYWVGGTFELTTLDPVKFYADVIYGAGAQADRKSAKRSGWFADFAAEYTGWDVLTPQVFGWWSTGEDKSTGNGSERMPTIVPNWGPGNNFLFDSSQEFTLDGNMGVNPVGAWGLGASLNNISFMEKLTHRLTFIYMRGTNSPNSIRNVVNQAGTDNGYFIMGRDLTWNESLVSVNLDSTYQIYENLAAMIETGWAHGNFQKHVWGRTLYDRAANGDVWKVTFGLSYKF